MVGCLDIILHDGSIWTVTRAVLSFTLNKSKFIHFLHHGIKCYDNDIKSDNRNKYIVDDGSGMFPKQMVRNVTIKNIKGHILIDIMLFKVTI